MSSTQSSPVSLGNQRTGNQEACNVVKDLHKKREQKQQYKEGVFTQF